MTSYNAQFGMSNPNGQIGAAQTPWYGSPEAIATLISGISQGASSAFSRPSAMPLSNNKKEAKESKRRIKANLLNQSIENSTALNRANRQYQDEMRDFQSQAMQQVARGFVDALRGSTM